MNGCQLAVFTNRAQKAMNISTTATLTVTITLLKRADSLMPMTRIIVTTAVINMAGMFNIAPVA